MKQYFTTRNYLYVLLILNLLLETLLTVYVFHYESFIIDQLNQVYKYKEVEKFKQFFEMITKSTAALNSLLFMYGFYTVFSHRVTNYLVFNIALMVSIFTGIMLTYLNVLNILTFIVKCFTYVYSRYVLSQLYTVLIIPRDYSFVEQNQQLVEGGNEQNWSSEAAVLNDRFDDDDENSRLIDNNYVPDALQDSDNEDNRLIEVNYMRGQQVPPLMF